MKVSKCLVVENTVYPTQTTQVMSVTKIGETTAPAFPTPIAQVMRLFQIGQSFAVNLKL